MTKREIKSQIRQIEKQIEVCGVCKEDLLELNVLEEELARLEKEEDIF